MKSCHNCAQTTSVDLTSPCFSCFDMSKYVPMKMQTTGYEMSSERSKANARLEIIS